MPDSSIIRLVMVVCGFLEILEGGTVARLGGAHAKAYRPRDTVQLGHPVPFIPVMMSRFHMLMHQSEGNQMCAVSVVPVSSL